jgi:hypothetical protein
MYNDVCILSIVVFIILHNNTRIDIFYFMVYKWLYRCNIKYYLKLNTIFYRV